MSITLLNIYNESFFLARQKSKTVGIFVDISKISDIKYTQNLERKGGIKIEY